MSERKYSVREIDALRKACETRWIFGTTNITSAMFACGITGRVYKAGEKVIAVEQLVRTYMLAGITAEDIYEEDFT